MNLKEAAEKLNGNVFGFDIEKSFQNELKENGIVVVYGYSDDLMEFDGVFRDEAGVYNGGIVELNEFVNFETNATIEALWCVGDKYDFQYVTDIPHETFDVLNDDENYEEENHMYCQGIVFYLKDLLRKD